MIEWLIRIIKLTLWNILRNFIYVIRITVQWNNNVNNNNNNVFKVYYSNVQCTMYTVQCTLYIVQYCNTL